MSEQRNAPESNEGREHAVDAVPINYRFDVPEPEVTLTKQPCV